MPLSDPDGARQPERPVATLPRKTRWTAAQGLEAALLGWAWGAAASRDPDAASDLGASLGRFFGPRTRKHRHVVANLRTAFPDWLPHRVEATARDVWAAAGRTLLEYPALGRIGDPAESRVRVVDLGGLEAVRGTGRPGVFVSGHLGNWNLLPVAADLAGVPLSVVYRRLRNPAVERLMAGWRATMGCRFLEVEGATRSLLRELRAGRSVGLLMDQRYDRGANVPFFGLPAPTTLVPARLALRSGLPLIPTRVQRLEGARFVVTIHQPVRPEPGLDEDTAARRMTEAVNGLIARWIAADPAQWLCAKRRWPRRRPHRWRGPRRGTVMLT